MRSKLFYALIFIWLKAYYPKNKIINFLIIKTFKWENRHAKKFKFLIHRDLETLNQKSFFSQSWRNNLNLKLLKAKLILIQEILIMLVELGAVGICILTVFIKQLSHQMEKFCLKSFRFLLAFHLLQKKTFLIQCL